MCWSIMIIHFFSIITYDFNSIMWLAGKLSLKLFSTHTYTNLFSGCQCFSSSVVISPVCLTDRVSCKTRFSWAAVQVKLRSLHSEILCITHNNDHISKPHLTLHIKQLIKASVCNCSSTHYCSTNGLNNISYEFMCQKWSIFK